MAPRRTRGCRSRPSRSVATPTRCTPRRPEVLEHIRIVELGQVIAGTFGGMILSDLGAEVIKVEPPAGDAGRRSAIYGIEIGFDRMRAVNPEVVLVSVSGFGLHSPYRDLPAYDLILQAMTGHMSIMGESGRPPVIMGIPVADLLAGVFSAIAVLAGVEGRRNTGEGAHLD